MHFVVQKGSGHLFSLHKKNVKTALFVTCGFSSLTKNGIIGTKGKKKSVINRYLSSAYPSPDAPLGNRRYNPCPFLSIRISYSGSGDTDTMVPPQFSVFFSFRINTLQSYIKIALWCEVCVSKEKQNPNTFSLAVSFFSYVSLS